MFEITRIINGRRYSTKTATRVAYVGSRNPDVGDFRYHDTWLCVTAKGSWFLAGEGNALSRWSRSYGQNGSTGGAGIEPISKGEALEELEAIGATKLIEKYFADSVQDA